jgi:hypothetical protein
MGVACSRAIKDGKKQSHGLMAPVCRPIKDITQNHFESNDEYGQERDPNHQFPHKDVGFVHSHHKFIQTSHTLLLR